MSEPDKTRDAILAGLRLLQHSLDTGAVTPDDGDIGDILTCGGEHEGMTATEIDAYCEQTNTTDTVLPAVVIVTEGGLIQDVTTNQAMKILVIDYDTEGTSDPVCQVDQGDVEEGESKSEAACVWLVGEEHPEYVNGRIAKFLATDGKEC